MKPLRAGDPLVVGPYRLAARLGSGGMGVVYLGVDGRGRQGAVKVLRDEHLEDEGFRRRFTREAAAIASIDSPRVARLLDAEPDGDPPWIATEYVHGPTLLHAVTADGPPGPEGLRALATGLAEALRAIHDADVVHRDLKPSNVILAADGPTVIDFGIAAGLPGTMTASGVVLGSIGYMAPELISGDVRPGPAADVFGWALTVAFAATGRAPFGDGPLQALVLRTVQGAADIDGVPEDLRPVVTTALRTRPELRPAAADLLRWLLTGTPPVDLGPDPAAEPAAAEPAATAAATEPAATEPTATEPAATAAATEPAATEPTATEPTATAAAANPAEPAARRAGLVSARRRDEALMFLDVVTGSDEPAPDGPGRAPAAHPDPDARDSPGRPAWRRRAPAVGRRLVPAAGVVAIVAAAAGVGVGPGDVLGDAFGMTRSSSAAGQGDLWKGIADGADAASTAAPGDRGGRHRAAVETPPLPEPEPAVDQGAVVSVEAATRSAWHGRGARAGTGAGAGVRGPEVTLPRVDVEVKADVDAGRVLAAFGPVQVRLSDLADPGALAWQWTCPLERTALAAGCAAPSLAQPETPTMVLSRAAGLLGGSAVPVTLPAQAPRSLPGFAQRLAW